MFEPQSCPAITLQDSESYWSLHTDDQSEDGGQDRLKDRDEFGQTEVNKNTDGLQSDSHVHTEEQQLITSAVETNNQSKHTQTRFCVVMWAVNDLRNGYMTIYDSSTKVLLNTSHWQKSFGVNGIVPTIKPLHQLDRFSALITVSLE